MLVVVLAAMLIRALDAVTGHAPGLPNAWGLAACYGLLAVLTGACARPPRRARLRPALRVLGSVALVSFCVRGSWTFHCACALTLWWLSAAAFVAIWRRASIHVVSLCPSLLPARRPVAFIGNSDAACRMFHRIAADPFSRLNVLGFFDDRADRDGPLSNLLPRLGDIDSLVSFIHENELHDVYMALPWTAGPRISVLLDRMRFLPLTVRLLPDQAPPALRTRDAHQFGGVVMPTLMLPPFSAVGATIKRAIDIFGSVVLLLLLLPLFIAVAVAIKIDSAGPVFFSQARSGQYGRSFNIFKFRSLHVATADRAAETLVERGDTRVTRVGRTLRKYSVDELPQIVNVLLGDMSLVGPRPHATRAKADGRIYAEIIPEYMMRYRVKPGMTGWAQVNGWRGNTDTEEKLRKRVEFDFTYISQWSPVRDFEILLRTIPSVLMPTPDNL